MRILINDEPLKPDEIVHDEVYIKLVGTKDEVVKEDLVSLLQSFLN